MKHTKNQKLYDETHKNQKLHNETHKIDDDDQAILEPN